LKILRSAQYKPQGTYKKDMEEDKLSDTIIEMSSALGGAYAVFKM